MDSAGHHQRFSSWLRDHAAMLHHVANGFAEGADRHDLMQELLLALWRAVPAFRGDARPTTFIYRVAHNAALTWRRSSKNYRRKVEAFESDASVGAAAPAPDSRGEGELLALVYAEIRRLPPLDRSLILLHLDGASYAQMAEIHGLSESNVGVRLNRLKQKLSESMKEVSNELH